MAGFIEMAVKGLTEEDKLYYESKTLNLLFSFERDVNFTNFLAKWTNFDIKVIIEDIDGGILYQDSSWIQLTTEEYTYNTDLNMGKLALINIKRNISKVGNIGKIIVSGKRGGKIGNDADYNFTLKPDEKRLCKDIVINADGTGFNYKYYDKISFLYSSKKSTVNNPNDITVNGIGDAGYINSKYHNGKLLINVTSMQYLGDTVLPDKVELINNTNEIYPLTQKRMLEKNKWELDFAHDKILENYQIKMYVKNAIYTKDFKNSIYPIASFVYNDLDLANMEVKAYKNEVIQDTEEGYKINQWSEIGGSITIKDQLNSPYEFILGNEGFGMEGATEKGSYALSGNSLKLSAYQPYGNFIYTFSSSSNQGEWNRAVDFLKEQEYNIFLKVKNKFVDEEDEINIPINKEKIQFLFKPVILNNALKCKIIIGATEFSKPLILNPSEAIEIKIDKNFVYFPDRCSDWKSLEEEIECNNYIIIDIPEKNFYLEQAEQIFYTYDNFLNEFGEEDSVEFTRFAKCSLELDYKNIQAFGSEKTVRIGRIKPIEVSWCQVKGENLIYFLTEYGGDKTETEPASTFIPYDSSLIRSGREKLLILLYKENETEAFANMVITGEENLKKFFYENAPKSLPLKDFKYLDTEENLTEKDYSKIYSIEGQYSYSYDGIQDQIIFFQNTEGNSIILVENLTNNPTWSLRKNGVIINGKPKQQLTKIEENGEVVGYNFFEINAINEKDRIVINFPNGINEQGESQQITGEIYQSNGKIHLRGFVLDP